MRFLNKIILIAIISSISTNYSFALTNNEIIKLCKRERRPQDCIKKVKVKRYKLNRGKPIEIIVVPFKK